MNKDQSIDMLYDYLFCLLIILLPLSFALPNIVLIFLVLIFWFDYKRTVKLDFSSIKRSEGLVAFSMVLYWYGKDFLTGNLLENKHSLFLLIILIPILFLKVKEKTRIYTAFIVAGFIIVFRALSGLISYYLHYHQGLPFEGAIVNDILGMERPYLGFVTLLSIVASFYMAQKIKRFSLLFYSYALMASIFIFIISARISSISLLFLALLYLTCYLKTALKFKLLFGVLALLIAGTVISINKNIRERLFLSGDSNERILKLTSYEPRLVIWPCASEIAKRPDFNLWFGIHAEKTIEDLLVQGYNRKISNKYRADYYTKVKLNTHNQFLGTYLNSGAIGLLLLVTLLIFQFLSSRKNFITTAMLLILFMFLLVENVLFRQIGVYFFALILAITMVEDKKRRYTTD